MKRNNIIIYIKAVCFTILTGFLPLGAFSQEKKSAETILPLDPLVRTGKLSNGFTYYIRHNEEPKNRVTLYLVNKVGSVLEDEDQRGLAHLTEHMGFKGTKHFPHDALVDYLQKSGVSFGADVSAYTSFDETVYKLPIPSDNPELLKSGIEIMRDWAHEALLDPADIEKERGIVLEEKRLGKGADERMRMVYLPVILNNSRYAERDPIGLDEVLNNFKRPTLARFYNDWYRPDLQALIVVGDINVNQVEEQIKLQYSNLKNPVNERPRVKFTVPLNGQNHFLALTDKEMIGTKAEIRIKHKAPELKTASDYRTLIVQNMFNTMLNGRYTELLNQPDPPFMSGGAGFFSLIGDVNSYNVSVTAKPGELERGLKAVWRETERLKRFGFTSKELEQAKLFYMSQVEGAFKEKDKTNSDIYAKKYQDNFLTGVFTPGIEEEYQLTKDDLPGITLTDVNNIAKKYITNTDRDIMIRAPEKDKDILPDEAKVSSWLKAVEAESLAPYYNKEISEPLLSVTTVPGKIESEEVNKKVGVITLKLSNGVNVLLKPTDFKNNEVIFSAFAPGGTSLYSDADYQSATNATSFIWVDGINNMGGLNKYLVDRQASVRPFITERFEGIDGGSSPQDLETAMQMIYACFTQPRKNVSGFKGIITRAIGSLDNRANDPNTVFHDTVGAVMGGYNIRRTAPTTQKLEQINLDRAYQIYKERFADAGNFTFVFVGSIDTNAIKPMLEKYLGSLPTTNQHEQAKDLNINPPAGEIKKTVYKGAEAKATAYLIFTGKYDYSPGNNMKMAAMREALKIRLLQNLREDQNGVYNPEVEESQEKLPQQRYTLAIEFGCAPQNVEKLIASALDEVNKMKTEGPSQEIIDKWRAEEKTDSETEFKTNEVWLNYLVGQMQNGQRLEELNENDNLADAVKPADVKAMAQKYLSGENYIRLVLMPENF